MNLETSLQHLGLSKQEAALYLTVLTLGTAKASEISRKTKINRSGAYYILKLLTEKGFLSEVIKSGVKYYSATSPTRLSELLEEEKTRKQDILGSIHSELMQLQESSIEKPTIEVYEGYAGFKTIFSRVLEKSGENLRCYLSPDVLSYLPHFHEQFRKRRMKKGISIKTITAKTALIEEIKKTDVAELREVRYADSFFKGVSGMQYILDDALIFVKANQQEQIAIYIQDADFAKLQNAIFDEQWEKLK